MKSPRVVLAIWVAVILVLVIVEVAEVTHFFTVPIASALGDPVELVLSLVFTTVLALVGAIFIGIYISHRILSPSGFSPFEEEMLRMRADLRDVKQSVEEIRRATPPPPPKGGAP